MSRLAWMAWLIVAVAVAVVGSRSVSALGFASASEQDPLLSTSDAPTVINDGFECSDGVHAQAGVNGLVPDGWTAVPLLGNPRLNSTRIEFAGSCEGSGFIERIEGFDSLAILSEDIESLPEPGKPRRKLHNLYITLH